MQQDSLGSEQLKDTVRALRQALETALVESAAESQQMHAELEGEILQLQQTIAALRAQLEQQRNDTVTQVQAAKLAADDETTTQGHSDRQP